MTRLANQIIVALNIAAMSEALVLAMKAGVDPELVFEAIKGGLAGSTVLNAKAPMALARNITPGFRINLHIKDLDNAPAAGHAVGVPLPFHRSVYGDGEAEPHGGSEWSLCRLRCDLAQDAHGRITDERVLGPSR